MSCVCSWPVGRKYKQTPTQDFGHKHTMLLSVDQFLSVASLWGPQKMKWRRSGGGGNRGVGCLSEGIRGHPYNYSTTTPPDSSCGLNVTQLAVRGQRLWTQHVICVCVSQNLREKEEEKSKFDWFVQWFGKPGCWHTKRNMREVWVEERERRRGRVRDINGKEEKVNAWGLEQDTHTEEAMPKKHSTQHRYQRCSTAYGRGFWHWRWS